MANNYRKIFPALLGLVVLMLPPRGEAEQFKGTVFIIDGPVRSADPDPAGDTDCDGLPDEWEAAHGLDPLDPCDAGMDIDGDGLRALDEYRNNTDPWDIDTDADLLADSNRNPSGPPPEFSGKSDAVNDCELTVLIPI